MAANLEQATRESALDRNLVGDLESVPDPTRRLWDQEVYGLDFAIPYLALSEAVVVRGIITERMAMLDAELHDPRCRFLDQMVKREVHHQMRVRPDYQKDKVTVEQWVPALKAWIVNGYFDWATPSAEIIGILQAGDPRHQTASDALEERRGEAAKARAVNDAAGTEKVLAAVDSLSSRSLSQFIEVEEALQTGDLIHCHGDDLAQIEAMHDRTRHDAAHGDLHAQHVLTHGQRDDSTCILPSTNPLTHQHGSIRPRQS